MATERDEIIGSEIGYGEVRRDGEQLVLQATAPPHSAGTGKWFCRRVHWPLSKTLLSRFHISFSSTETFGTYFQNGNTDQLY